ncbi:MAG: peptide deformylase [Bacteroidales bacterium]
MKNKLIVLFVVLLISTGMAHGQEFWPEGFLLDIESPEYVLKSHNLKDSTVLATVSKPIDPNNTVLIREIVSKLFRTVTDSLSAGVGIAAPQVGISKRIILVQRFDKPSSPFEAYVNPAIIQKTELTKIQHEGCLSVDNTRLQVKRPYAILVGYFTVNGEYKFEMVEDFTARIFQHEIDHLNGILFTQRAMVSKENTE